MKKTPAILLIFFFLVAKGQAQNFPTREHNFMTGLIYNPAVAGTEDNIVAVLTARRSWIGIKDGPGTNMLNIHGKGSDLGFSRPKKYISNGMARTGLGMTLYNDRNGPLSTNGLQLAFAYHMDLNAKTILSMGLSAKLAQYVLDETVFRPTDPGDPNITFNKQKTLIPNFNAGIFLHHKNYYIGLSTTNLAAIKRSERNFYNEENIRTLYLSNGYKFTLSNSKVLETTMLLRALNNKLWFDLTARYHYRKFLWFGAGYATRKVFSFYGAIRLNKLDFGYVYEYYTSPVYNASKGNHMIFIGYNL